MLGLNHGDSVHFGTAKRFQDVRIKTCRVQNGSLEELPFEKGQLGVLPTEVIAQILLYCSSGTSFDLSLLNKAHREFFVTSFAMTNLSTIPIRKTLTYSSLISVNLLRDEGRFIDAVAYRQVFGKNCLQGQEIPVLPDHVFGLLKEAEKMLGQKCMLLLLPQKVLGISPTVEGWFSLMFENKVFKSLRADVLKWGYASNNVSLIDPPKASVPTKARWVIATVGIRNGSLGQKPEEQETYIPKGFAPLSVDDTVSAVLMRFALTKGDTGLEKNIYMRTKSLGPNASPKYVGFLQGCQGPLIIITEESVSNENLGTVIAQDLETLTKTKTRAPLKTLNLPTLNIQPSKKVEKVLTHDEKSRQSREKRRRYRASRRRGLSLAPFCSDTITK